MRRLLYLFGLAAVTAALVPVGVAAAAPFSVTNPNSSGMGTLRDAINETNFQAGPDTITIEITGAIKLAEALPTITDDVTIVGPGAGSLTVERAAATEFRIFDFGPGVTATLSGVTVTGGADPEGAGIAGDSTDLTLLRVVVADNEAWDEAVDVAKETALATGGGIFNTGPLTVRESVIRDNRAIAVDGGMLTRAIGAGVAALGPVTIDRSTISGNVAEAERGKQTRAWGGGLSATEGAVVERSTISGNSVFADGGLTNEARGGGLRGANLTLTSSTVTGNSLTSIGFAAGANLELAGTTLARNTIVANALGDASSCGETLSSGGYNLDEDGSCGLVEGSDLVGVDPLLAPLADNGGPTPTHALQPDSIAIDRGKSFGATADQRGFSRPVDFTTISNKEGGDGSDIGAFELQAPPQLATITGMRIAEVPGDRQPPNTRIVSGPARVTFERLATFRFASTEAQSRFQCKVDKSRWRGCRNPFKRKVSAGKDAGRKHVFKVRAIDRFGNVDKSPARFSWRVKKVGG